MKKTNPAYTAEQERALEAIPYGKGKGPHTSKLKSLARKWKKKYENVWQKWYLLHRTMNQVTATVAARKTHPKVTAPDSGVKAMTFTTVNFEGVHHKADEREIEAMKKGLDALISSGSLNNKRAIVFPTRLERYAREHFQKNYPKDVFSFHSKKGDHKNKLLVKKV